MRNTLIAATLIAAISTPAMASYWNGCGKYVDQYYDEPWVSKETACDRIKSCKARNECHVQLDWQVARLEKIRAGHPSKKVCFELGDASSKTYEEAKCMPIKNENLPYECAFADGVKSSCFKHANGCFVCAGMD